MAFNQPLSLRVARGVARAIYDLGIWKDSPVEVCFVPYYDTTTEAGIKVYVIPSNISIDSTVGRDVSKIIFTTQIVIMKYLSFYEIEEAEDVLLVSESMLDLAGKKISLTPDSDDNDYVEIETVFSNSPETISWNGNWQIDGLIEKDQLAHSNVYTATYIVCGTRYIEKT